MLHFPTIVYSLKHTSAEGSLIFYTKNSDIWLDLLFDANLLNLDFFQMDALHSSSNL